MLYTNSTCSIPLLTVLKGNSTYFKHPYYLHSHSATQTQIWSVFCTPGEALSAQTGDLKDTCRMYEEGPCKSCIMGKVESKLSPISMFIPATGLQVSPSTDLQRLVVKSPSLYVKSLMKWNIPSRPSNVISGHWFHVCKQTWHFKYRCLQLWWFLVCGNPGIITKSFNIYASLHAHTS